MNSMTGRSAAFNRVLVVDNLGIMGAGLERVLAEDKSLEVLGHPLEDETTLIHEIWRLLPDFIILILESQTISPISLLEHLSDYGPVSIVQVSMESNLIDVYNRQQILVSRQNSLVDLLKRK